MPVSLGIDTGGTYTDAVLFEETQGVLASAKVLTTHEDLSAGIDAALDRLPGNILKNADLVSLSTTLATNAVVEGRGSRVCLILIGYPDDALTRGGLGEAIEDNPVVFIRGGHTVAGEEQEPLDENAARQAALTHAGSVEAFAVSGYFGVKNPSHENKVRRIIRSATDCPVTCGHELTTNLHASRRALTAALNARLVPLLETLIDAVQSILKKRHIDASFMVVKGDGSLMAADYAREYPIETILSGPAASVLGASYLSGLKNAVIADMGGTTTDISILRDGMPVLNPEGAVVGGWKTMVEAIKIHTYGLGGDSEISFGPGSDFKIGPGRIIPISLLAVMHPEVICLLASQAEAEELDPDAGVFVLAGNTHRPFLREGLSRVQTQILERLGSGFSSLSGLASAADSRFILTRDLSRLVRMGLAVLSGFTPSDASHILGYLDIWSKEAAIAAARIMARKTNEAGAEDPLTFSRRVLEAVSRSAAADILLAGFAEDQNLDMDKHPHLFTALTRTAFFPKADDVESIIDIGFSLRRKLVGIGAPAATYFPAAGALLSAEVVVPRYAEVANAIGAAAGTVMGKSRILVTPCEESFRVYFHEGVLDFPVLEDAISFAKGEAESLASDAASRAGAASPRVHVTVDRRTSTVLDGEMLVEVIVTAAATGRPRLKTHEKL